MNFKKLVMVLAVLTVFAAPLVVLTDTSDAYIELPTSDKPYGTGFTNSGNGTLHVPLVSTEGTDVDITITVRLTSSSALLATKTVTVPAGSADFVAELNFKIDGVGGHDITVTCTPAYLFPLEINTVTVNVNVSQTIWSQWTTYAAIGVVVLLIVILAFIRMRSAPATKPDTTFTELEKGRGGAERAEPEKKPAAPTERRRYSSSSESSKPNTKSAEPKKAEKKPEPKPEPREKKVESFTELDKQKSEKKVIKETADKPSKDGEPKKLKYVSSRRK